MTLEMPDVDLSEEERKEKKKKAQHEAWKRWYDSPKGQAHRAKRRKRQTEDLAK